MDAFIFKKLWVALLKFSDPQKLERLVQVHEMKFILHDTWVLEIIGVSLSFVHIRNAVVVSLDHETDWKWVENVRIEVIEVDDVEVLYSMVLKSRKKVDVLFHHDGEECRRTLARLKYSDILDYLKLAFFGYYWADFLTVRYYLDWPSYLRHTHHCVVTKVFAMRKNHIRVICLPPCKH